MWTLTTREWSHPETIAKAFRMAIKRVNDQLYGTFKPSRDLGVGWLLGHERHKTGQPHAHAIIYAFEDNFDELVQRRDSWAWWFEERGINRLEPVRSSKQAAAYCTKYVLKDGEVTFSDNFSAFVKFYREAS